MQRVVALADPLHPPLEDVSHRRLPGLDAVVAGHDRAVHDPADAGDVLDLLLRRGDGAVAGGGPDDLDQGAASDAGPHGAVVGVEGAHGDGDPLGEPQPRRPLPVEHPRRPVGGPGLLVEAVPELGEAGVEAGQELLRREPAPGLGVHGLVAGRAHAPLDVAGILDAGQDRGDVVRQLHPARGGLEDVGGHLQAAPDLGPEPLRRVDAADGREVFGGVVPGHRGDGRRLLGRGVVLPEPGMGGEVVPPGGVEGQGPVAPSSPGWASSRWCPPRCRSPRPGRSPPSRRPPRGPRGPRPRGPRGSRPDSAGRGGDSPGRGGSPGRPRGSRRPRSPTSRPSAQSKTTLRTELVPKSIPMVNACFMAALPDS